MTTFEIAITKFVQKHPESDLAKLCAYHPQTPVEICACIQPDEREDTDGYISVRE